MLPMMISRMKRLHLLKIVLVITDCMSINMSEKVFSAPKPLIVMEYQPIVKQAAPQQPALQKPKTKPISDLSSYESVEVMATGYTAGIESTGKSSGHPQYGITYSGVKVRKGMVSTIAADTKVFPLGTLLYIPGYGYGLVADTGSAIKGNKIDLYFLNKKEVYANWGKKKVNVYVLKRGDGKVTEAMLDRLNEMKAFAQHPPIMQIEL
jgi:3D (Asp-Asp-Asp) domain-containing protein